MVIATKLSRFARQQDGTALVEGLLVFPLVLLTFAAFFEFGYAVFQWNQTVKALQAGARHIAVSDPLISTTQMANFDGGGPSGDPVPGAVVSESCGAGTTPCVASEMNRLIYGANADGTDDQCGNAAENTIPGMCDFNTRIGVNNVLATYYRAGLGYEGRPDGPVLTIRLEVKDLNFDLPLVGALLSLDTITIPAHPVTITSEDLCSTRSC
jgi:hypothetical protein